MYFPITSGHSAQYIGMAEMKFGSAATNGLKWMAISACNCLHHADWTSMQTAGVQPYNSNLHLILGSDSPVWAIPHAESLWAQYMTVGTNGTIMTIQAAWYQGQRDAYAEGGFNYTNAVILATSGSSACQNDRLQTNSTPSGGSFYDSTTVWP